MIRVQHRVSAGVLVSALLAGSLSALAGAFPAQGAPSADAAPLVVDAANVSGGASSAGPLDLTQMGSIDWIHPTGERVDRKAGADLVTVENLNPDQPVGTFDDSPYSYRWSDGAPTAQSAGVTSGAVYNYDRKGTGEPTRDAGYRVVVPAADSVREAVIVGGVWQATSDITVSTGLDTPALYTDEAEASTSSKVYRYTVTLRPGQGAVFTSRLTDLRIPDGNASLAAVAVRELPVTVDNVTLDSENVPESLDLTAQGTVDWIHLSGATLNRAQNGGVLTVANRNPDRVISAQSDNPVVYRWNNGTPQAEQAGTRQGGVFLASSDDMSRPAGFDLTVAADDRARTLRFTSGVWQASTRISVTVNGESAPLVATDELTAGGTPVSRLFSVNLRPGDDAVVTAQLTGRTSGDGNVTLGAAVLSARSSAIDELGALLATIDGTDLAEASDLTMAQLLREIDAAKELLQQPASGDDAARIQFILLQAAFRAAQNSIGDVQYSYQTNPGLVSSFGWEGDRHAPIAYIDGSYLLRDRGELMVTFGVPDIPGTIEWTNAEGYLPAFISSFSKRGLDVSIQSFSDDATVSGNRFEVAYSRMTVTNTSAEAQPLPVVSAELVPLTPTTRATTIAPGDTVVRDYAIAADRFTGTYAWPSTAEVAALGSYDEHYGHMRDYWNTRLDAVADISKLPNEKLINAYKAGYIYTLIIRDDIDGEKRLHVGENGYDEMFDHDTIGIVANLLTIGDFTYAQDYLRTLPAQLQYDDAKWKFSWPFALYLQRTGDEEFVRAEFENIKTQTHKIEADRIDGGTGIIKQTFAIDSLGYWTIDNWSALAGLTTYRYLAERIGETAEADWAKAEYDDLYRATTERLQQTIDENNLDYIPISMVEPNEDGPRSDPRDANWASMFLFGRWAWDGYLFGAEQSGLMLDWIDQTYTAGFDRRNGISDTIYNFGGYPHGYYSSAYNAGYGSSALRGEQYRDAGIRAYEFMIDKAQSGPFGWWEGVDYPNAESPWSIDHAAGGGGSNQHMWGQSTATKVLFDSLIAQKSDGTLIIGRGIPTEWIAAGQEIALDDYPVQDDGRVGYSMTSTGSELTFAFTGDTTNVTDLSIEVIGLKNNIARVSTPGAVIDQAAGTVRVPSGTEQVVITLGEPVTITPEPGDGASPAEPGADPDAGGSGPTQPAPGSGLATTGADAAGMLALAALAFALVAGSVLIRRRRRSQSA